MLKPATLVVDTNVWIAYFIGDDDMHRKAKRFFHAADEHQTTLVYAAVSAKDVFYVVPRQLRMAAKASGDDMPGISYLPYGWACIRSMTEMAVAATTGLPECDLAWMLRNQHGDFEDNLIIATAETCGADYVVTYDRQLIERFAPVCITPDQALNILQVA